MAKKLPTEPDIIELDVTNPEHIAAAGGSSPGAGDRVDGVLHSIGFAPPVCLGGSFLDATWDDVSPPMNMSAYSLQGAGRRVDPPEGRRGLLVGLDFDAAVAWPAYDWMGVAKAALESTPRYLARDLGPHGVRVNLVAAGPIKTIAARSIPGFHRSRTRGRSGRRSAGTSRIRPLSPRPASPCSPTGSLTTGEIIHVDGGFDDAYGGLNQASRSGDGSTPSRG